MAQHENNANRSDFAAFQDYLVSFCFATVPGTAPSRTFSIPDKALPFACATYMTNIALKDWSRDKI